MDSRYVYSNKFMYFIFGRDESNTSSWLYCSGVSMPQFLPITRGRHGLASNPAMRGLQITDLNLRKELHDRGAYTASVKENPCSQHVPKEGDWYRQLLSISNADEQVVKELVRQCPQKLVSSIFQACLVTDAVLPEVAQSAVEFESFLAAVCKEYSKQSGWATTASIKGFRK
ncbi:MAG: hypothetical protein ACLP29_07360 [Dissulfurispiraceae bacterium]